MIRTENYNIFLNLLSGYVAQNPNKLQIDITSTGLLKYITLNLFNVIKVKNDFFFVHLLSGYATQNRNTSLLII